MTIVVVDGINKRMISDGLIVAGSRIVSRTSKKVRGARLPTGEAVLVAGLGSCAMVEMLIEWLEGKRETVDNSGGETSAIVYMNPDGEVFKVMDSPLQAYKLPYSDFEAFGSAEDIAAGAYHGIMMVNPDIKTIACGLAVQTAMGEDITCGGEMCYGGFSVLGEIIISSDMSELG